MRHEAGDVAIPVAKPRDVVDGAVGIARGIIRSVGSRVTKNDLMIFFESCESGFVATVISVGVRDGNLEDLAFLGGIGERRVGLLDADVHVAADETQAAVAHHGAGKQAGFAENLEAVANAQDQAAARGEFLDGLHHRRKARDGAGAEIVAVGKSAGQNDGVAAGEIFRLVPDEFDRFLQDVADGVKRVVVAIGPGKNDDSKFHAVQPPVALRELLF
jgi:hypothetical protein